MPPVSVPPYPAAKASEKAPGSGAVFVLPGVSCRVGAERSIRIVPAVVLLCMSKMAEKPECAIDTVRDYS